MSQESQDDLERPLLEWLHHAGCSEALQDQLDAEENDQCITIQVDAMEALALSHQIGQELISAPESVRRKVIEEMLSVNVSPDNAQRVWLRVAGVPMRPVPVSVVHSTVKPGDSVHVYGVCTSGESAHKRVASRMVKCPHCRTAQRHMLLAGIALQQCCTESAGTSPAAWEEDVTGCLFIPVQRIFLSDLSSASPSSGVHASGLCIELQGDDLVGQVAAGTCVSVFGTAALTHLPDANAVRAWTAIQVRANNVIPFQPRQLIHQPPAALDWEAWSAEILSRPDQLLTGLCDAMGACLEPQPLPDRAMLCLLLSAVTAGQSISRTARSSADRSQVHVLLTSAGQEPSLARAMDSAAALLSPLSQSLTSGLPLLPKATELKQQNAQTGWRLEESALGNAASGILCMQSHQLAKRDQERLADALQHQALRACSDPALTVPRTAVIWMSAADEAIAEQRKRRKDYLHRCQHRQGLAHEDHHAFFKTQEAQDVRSTGGANKGRLPPVLISHFDLTACYSCSRDVEFEERLVKHLLELSPGGAPSDTKDRASLKKCLEEHLRRAASLPQPKLSREASFLLQRYYLVLRQHAADADVPVTAAARSTLTCVECACAASPLCKKALRQHAAESDVLVTAAALSTLTRVASACACLHLRSEILATPDVVLSIMLLEESFKHQGRTSRLSQELTSMHGTEYGGETLAESISSVAALLIGHFCREDRDEDM